MNYKHWDDLTIKEQLNEHCDILAKSAIDRSLSPHNPPRPSQLLPQEGAAVIIGGIKATTDISRRARYTLCRVEAECFYVQELDWPTTQFDLVEWDVFHATLDSKPQMYKIWLAKQASGFCPTQAMVSHWIKEHDNKCPNCGNRETANHFNLCPDENRT